MGNRSKATLRYYFVCVCSIYVQPLREGFLLLYLPCVRYPSSTQRRKQNSKHYTEGLIGTSKPRQDKQYFLVRTHKPLQNATTPFGKKDNPCEGNVSRKLLLLARSFSNSQDRQHFGHRKICSHCRISLKRIAHTYVLPKGSSFTDTKHQQTTAHHSNPFFSVMAIV